MRRKNEEELIKLAFGDMEPTASERTKKMLAEDSEAAKLFAGYSEIREGLKQLKTPEHQLSTERLREAILKQGLKKRDPFAGWKWTFAPLAVAAAAFLITLRMGGQADAPVVSNFDPTPTKVVKSPIDFSPTERVADVVPSPSVTQPTFRSERVATALRSTGRSNATQLARNVQSTTRSLVAKRTPSLSPADISRSAIDGALPAGAILPTIDLNDEQPIVLIGTESDESTGANRATEVSSPGNVVIGG